MGYKHSVKSLIVLAVIFCVVTTLLLSSCSDTPTGNTDGTAIDSDVSGLTEEETPTQIPDDLPERDYTGQTFNILSRVMYVYEFESEQQSGDTINDAVYIRNRTVSERYGVEIVTHSYGAAEAGANIMPQLDSSILAGDDSYQMAAVYTYLAAPQSADGKYLNWYQIPYVNLDKPWWSDGFISAASINDTTYIADGSLSLLFNEVIMSVFFNKTLAESYDIANLYDIVNNGKWTIDEMNAFIKLATMDLDGDGAITEVDRFGLGINIYTHVDNYQYAFEISLTERDENGLPHISIEMNKMQTALEKINSILNDSGDCYLSNQARLPEGMFEGDRALFMTSPLGDAAVYRAMDSDFGIIPYPKWDTHQEQYHTYALDRASTLVVPITVSDQEFAGIIIEAMAAESYRTVIPAFYEIALKGKFSRDNESQDMIDIIIENVSFDFGNIYTNIFGATGIGHLFRTCVNNKSNDFASLYASNESKFNETLAEFILDF